MNHVNHSVASVVSAGNLVSFLYVIQRCAPTRGSDDLTMAISHFELCYYVYCWWKWHHKFIANTYHISNLYRNEIKHITLLHTYFDITENKYHSTQGRSHSDKRQETTMQMRHTKPRGLDLVPSFHGMYGSHIGKQPGGRGLWSEDLVRQYLQTLRTSFTFSAGPAANS